MGNQINSVTSTQNVFTDIINESIQGCTATCDAINSNDIVIFDGAIITTNNFNILNNTCNVSASCVMQNIVSTDISNVVAATVDQTNKSVTSLLDGLPSDQDNFIRTNQNVTNYITQLLQSTCQASSTLSNIDNFFYFSGDANTKEFNALNNNGQASASCTMSNISKITVANNESVKASQSNTALGAFGLIILAVILIIILIIGGRALSSKGKGGNDDQLAELAQILSATKAK